MPHVQVRDRVHLANAAKAKASATQASKNPAVLIGTIAGAQHYKTRHYANAGQD
jgi:hypothetical protein